MSIFRVLGRPEESVVSPDSEATTNCKQCHCLCWKPNLGPLVLQQHFPGLKDTNLLTQGTSQFFDIPRQKIFFMCEVLSFEHSIQEICYFCKTC